MWVETHILKGTWKRRFSGERMGSERGDGCHGPGPVVHSGSHGRLALSGPHHGLPVDEGGGRCPPTKLPPFPAPPPSPGSLAGTSPLVLLMTLTFRPSAHAPRPFSATPSPPPGSGGTWLPGAGKLREGLRV